MDESTLSVGLVGGVQESVLNEMKAIKKIHPAENSPIADLVTFRALPTQSLDQLDPFIFLNHHGPQRYKPGNRGLPFGPHPHRGMETVTFILEGDILHKDSTGHESIITAGGIQWMTAGRGLIHAEVSSDNFKKNGGPLEILQLWVNLPAKLKMTDPAYAGFQKDQIPVVVEDEGRLTIQVVSGTWKDQKGAWQSRSDIHLSTVFFKKGGRLSVEVRESHSLLFYVIRGKLDVQGVSVHQRQMAEMTQEGKTLEAIAIDKSILLFGHAEPFREPVVAEGPFVMNTYEEIAQAYEDFQLGRFGTWNG
jgi:quercetin 2,3-dioxygenase